MRLTAKQRKVLEFCDQVPRTAQEILDMVGVKYHTKTLDQYVNKLVEDGLLRPTGKKTMKAYLWSVCGAAYDAEHPRA